MATNGFPRPSFSTIAAAVVGGPGSISGLQAGLSVSIDIHGEFFGGSAFLAGRIDKLGMSFKSFREPLTESLNKVLIPAIIQNFAEQGRPKWKALSQRTLQNRMYEGFQRGPILVKTGRLRREAARKNNWEFKSDKVVFRGVFFSQKVPYAGFQQMGSKTRYEQTAHHLEAEIRFPKGFFNTPASTFKPVQNMPARPFISMTAEDEVEVYGIFIAFLEKKVEKYWGSGSVGL